MTPTLREAYDLLHSGAAALSQVEANGIRVDVKYLYRTIRETEGRIGKLEGELKGDEVYRTWRQRFGDRAKLGSREQLATVLFDVLGLPSPGYTERSKQAGVKQRYRSDVEILSKVKLPFVRKFIELEKLRKVRGTYLEGIRRELVEGFIHPSFNLHLVQTYRSSSSDPNFQNLPIRDPVQGEIIRRCFIPRKGHLLVEVDFSGIEVRVAACYNKDPVLIKYIEDPTTDMHRDMAMELFLLGKEQVDKKTTRDWAKNRFVFPQFYGSVYFQCAPHLWEVVWSQVRSSDNRVSRVKLPDEDITILKHLRRNGIVALGDCDPQGEPEPGTFVYHVREVERKFWGERFQVYTDWKNRWYNDYLKKGWFDLFTGFRCSGVYKRNEVLNYPIQGDASLCKLWSLIRLQKYLNKHRMKTKIIGEIHDSILADCPENEIHNYLSAAKRIMTVSLPKAWPWIIVPLDVEAEVAGTNWYEKKQWTQVNGKWTPK